VEQHFPVLYGTLRYNIVYTAAHACEDEIARVVELANLTELVSRLPYGLDTHVGARHQALRRRAPAGCDRPYGAAALVVRRARITGHLVDFSSVTAEFDLTESSPRTCCKSSAL
jgi:hypothetical protein